MAQNYLQRGDTLTLPAAPYALEPGDGCLIDSIFGVSQNASLIAEECVLAVTGVHRLPKVLTEAITVGLPLYWDDGDKVVTIDDAVGVNPRIGVAVAAAPANSTVLVDVRLHGSW